MKRGAALFLFVALAAAPGARLLAHGGHDHKAMGTVTAVEKDRVDVKTTEGKDLSFVTTDATKYLKGKAQAAAADVKVGDRVVVTYTEDGDKKKASEVRFGVTSIKKVDEKVAKP